MPRSRTGSPNLSHLNYVTSNIPEHGKTRWNRMRAFIGAQNIKTWESKRSELLECFASICLFLPFAKKYGFCFHLLKPSSSSHSRQVAGLRLCSRPPWGIHASPQWSPSGCNHNSKIHNTEVNFIRLHCFLRSSTSLGPLSKYVQEGTV